MLQPHLSLSFCFLLLSRLGRLPAPSELLFFFYLCPHPTVARSSGFRWFLFRGGCGRSRAIPLRRRPAPPPGRRRLRRLRPGCGPFRAGGEGPAACKARAPSRAQCEAVVLTRSPSPALVAQAATRAASTKFGRWESTNANSCAPRRRPVWRSAMSLQAALARPRPGARKHRQTDEQRDSTAETADMPTACPAPAPASFPHRPHAEVRAPQRPPSPPTLCAAWPQRRLFTRLVSWE